LKSYQPKSINEICALYFSFAKRAGPQTWPCSLLSAAQGLAWASDGGFDTFLSRHKEYRKFLWNLLLCNGNWRIKMTEDSVDILEEQEQM